MTRLYITAHCLDRMAERLGIEADRKAVHAALMALPAIRAALDLGGCGMVLLPAIDAVIVLQRGYVVTVIVGKAGRVKYRPTVPRYHEGRVS